MCVLDMYSLIFPDALIIPQAQLSEQETKNSKDLVRSMHNFFKSMLNLQDAMGAYNKAVPDNILCWKLFFAGQKWISDMHQCDSMSVQLLG